MSEVKCIDRSWNSASLPDICRRNPRQSRGAPAFRHSRKAPAHCAAPRDHRFRELLAQRQNASGVQLELDGLLGAALLDYAYRATWARAPPLSLLEIIVLPGIRGPVDGLRPTRAEIERKFEI
jgi:hypothetical protein